MQRRIQSHGAEAHSRCERRNWHRVPRPTHPATPTPPAASPMRVVRVVRFGVRRRRRRGRRRRATELEVHRHRQGVTDGTHAERPSDGEQQLGVRHERRDKHRSHQQNAHSDGVTGKRQPVMTTRRETERAKPSPQAVSDHHHDHLSGERECERDKREREW